MSIVRALVNYDELLETYMTQGANIPTPATDLLYQNPKDVVSDEVKVLYSTMTRRPAPFNRRGAVARVIDKNGKSSREAAMFVQFNKQQFSQDVFMAVLNSESGRLIEAKAASEVEFHTEHARLRHKMSKEALAAKLLTGQTVYIDQNGDLRESSDNTYDAITFGFSSAHQGQLNNGSSAIITASWATAGTKILDHIENLQIRAASENQPPITRAIMNSSMKTHLRANTQFAAWIAASPNLAERTLRGDSIDVIGSLKFEFWDQTYLNDSGTYSKIIPDNMVIFLPATMDWVQPLRGLTLVPTSIEVGSGLNNLNEAYGEFAYTKMSEDPIGMDSYMGDVFGWCVKEPLAVWQATVVGF